MKAITIKPNYKHRVPFKPTQVHRNKKKYTRISKSLLKKILEGDADARAGRLFTHKQVFGRELK